jgi:hypothetical protein
MKEFSNLLDLLNRSLETRERKDGEVQG